jgi:hypothetical protein
MLVTLCVLAGVPGVLANRPLCCHVFQGGWGGWSGKICLFYAASMIVAWPAAQQQQGHSH